MTLLQRSTYHALIERAFRTHSVTAILGPRQCGKTTLARTYVKESTWNHRVHFFDLEDPVDVAALANPKTILEPLEGLIVIDEIQRIPDLFPVLRVLVDQTGVDRKFLILGSASRDLIRQSSETLAGRIAYIELTPLSLNEVDDSLQLWIQGGFPNSYLAAIEDSIYWRKQYILTFLERDIPSLGIHIPAPSLQRFWTMLAHYHGQMFNASEIGQSLGISDTTARHYLDILIGSFMIRQLQPWHTNTKKRQIKTPKIYFRDSGIFHSLSSITNYDSLIHHPKLGASWEGFALEQVIRCHNAEPQECFFWGIHDQAELDLLICKDGTMTGFEFKYGDAPRITPSMRIAKKTLQLNSLQIIYPGTKSFPLEEGISMQSLDQFLKTQSSF